MYNIDHKIPQRFGPKLERQTSVGIGRLEKTDMDMEYFLYGVFHTSLAE